MYSIRPHTSETIEFDLPTTMYRVQQVIQPIKQSTNESVLKDIEQRQDSLLEKVDYLQSQLALYLKIQDQGSNEKATCLCSVPIREELVVHLSAKQPSKDILNLIEKFHDKLSIRTYRHSSLRAAKFNYPIQNLSSSNNGNKSRSLAVVWADGDELPFMFHAHTKINDEPTIVTLLSQELESKD
ncbi:unnamed protein product [Rotaria socialis]|uniref:Uncharacterized protein n=1 Tax=Rotaria socialis TaxID=392032 RepID=A0A817ZJ60_9BILA|nr:unnamed protein product [Rotaria socialis]CAF3367958.1 unnamed protein product [Rotaria socialis]CAF3390233.1 unnamed protein product [Rotaria socialis]CAF3503006.1 unnamed protein product [Rotaria socialis]CAF4300987.1 unnamed protein product [Rotaria socialis]